MYSSGSHGLPGFRFLGSLTISVMVHIAGLKSNQVAGYSPIICGPISPGDMSHRQVTTVARTVHSLVTLINT